jgi:O-antigen ligase
VSLCLCGYELVFHQPASTPLQGADDQGLGFRWSADYQLLSSSPSGCHDGRSIKLDHQILQPQTRQRILQQPASKPASLHQGAKVPAQTFTTRAAGNSRSRSIARLLNSSIFHTLLLLTVLTAIPYGTAEAWWKAAFECALIALGLVWLLEGWLSGTLFVSQHRLLVPLLALAAFSLIQITLPVRSGAGSGVAGAGWLPLSLAPYDTKMFIYELLALIVAAGLLLRYTTNRRRLMVLAYVVIGVGLSSTIFGLVRMALQRKVGFVLPDLQPNDGTVTRGVGFAQFINHNHFAFLAEMSLGLVLGLMLRRPFRLARMAIGLTAAVPMWIAIVYSGSRGGLFNMLSQVLFVALLVFIAAPGRQLLKQNDKDRGGRRMAPFLVTRGILIASFLVAMVFAIAWVGGDRLAPGLESVPDEFGVRDSDRYTRTHRSTIWPMTWEMIKDHPVAGIGFGAYWIAITKYHHGSGEMTPQQAHNDYLELLASGGLLGAVIGLGFVWLFLREAIAAFRQSDAGLRALRVGALAGIFAVSIHSVVDFGLHMVVNGLVFLALVVIATIKVEQPELV